MCLKVVERSPHVASSKLCGEESPDIVEQGTGRKLRRVTAGVHTLTRVRGMEQVLN